MTTTRQTVTEPVFVFPAEVTLPDGRFIRPARVAVTAEQTVVWAESEDRRTAVVVFSQRTHSIREHMTANAPRRAQRMRVATDAGSVVVVRGGGCGCGSPLKRINPAAELGV